MSPDKNVDGIDYFELVISCPACLSEGKNPPAVQWYHGDCGGKMYVGDNAYYLCGNCNEKSHAKNWHYKCQSHFDYKATDSVNLAKAAAIAGQLTNKTGKLWLIKFLENLGDW